jgi:hypothetical protein
MKYLAFPPEVYPPLEGGQEQIYSGLLPQMSFSNIRVQNSRKLR